MMEPSFKNCFLAGSIQTIFLNNAKKQKRVKLFWIFFQPQLINRARHDLANYAVPKIFQKADRIYEIARTAPPAEMIPPAI